MNLCDDVTTVTTHLAGVRGGVRARMCGCVYVYAQYIGFSRHVVTQVQNHCFKSSPGRHEVVTGPSPEVCFG